MAGWVKMAFANLIIADQEWLLPALLLCLILVGLAVREYGQYRRGRGWAVTTALAVKIVGVVLLAVSLLNPQWSYEQAKSGANHLLVVADNSYGMRIRDPGASASRGKQMKQQLTAPGAGWQGKLSEDFRMRRYAFDERLGYVHDFQGLDFSGVGSALKTALSNLAGRYQGQPVAGMLLFTDGNATDAEMELPQSPNLSPVYPVVIGNDRLRRDLAVSRVTSSQTAFEDAPVQLEAIVEASGYAGRRVQLTVLDRYGKSVQHERRKVSGSHARLPFHLRFAPEERGVTYFRVRADAVDAAGNPIPKQDAKEATLLNNERMVVVERGDEPFRLLYVTGRPNWEYKFVKRSLRQDSQLHLVGLIRIAKREPKFEFKGRAGETSNPLYRGFDTKDETTAQYDQPVFLRLNARDKQELQGGFPDNLEALFSYDAVILDDLARDFLSSNQMMLLERLVSERGGGLLMLGGMESFAQGNFSGTPLADLLPVYLEPLPSSLPNGEVRFDLTREGWLQPWARLREERKAEEERIANMPAFQVVNQVRDPKPGATAVAEVTDPDGQRFPGLVTQRYGHGRSAALTIGDIWRWGLRDENSQDEMGQFWRQLARWLVAEVRRRVDVEVNRRGADEVELRARVRDKAFQPLDAANVAFHVRQVAMKEDDEPSGSQPQSEAKGNSGAPPAETTSVELEAKPASGAAGEFVATYRARERGAYHVKVVARDHKREVIGRDQAGWAANPLAEEFQSLRPNRTFLESLARKTGGEVLKPNQLEGWAEKLPRKSLPVMETRSSSAWHTPWLFGLALACFVVEWGLRRWRGLP